MPSLTTTIEDSSPLIQYSGNDWRTGSSSNDTLIEQYSQSNYMVTNVTNAIASFSFYGNGVQLFGAKRPYHGYYQISIDFNVYNYVNGQTTDAKFQTSLFASSALETGYHTVNIKNVDASNSNVDLDFITWQTPVGLDNEPIITTTVQDSDPSFVYNTPADWGTDPPNLGMFLGGSAHTTTKAVSVQLTFKVCGAVALYGPVGPNCGPYSVSLDGSTPANYSAAKPFYRPQQMLFQASHLQGGQDHTLLIQSGVQGDSGVYFAIDYAMVYTTPSLQGGDRSNILSVGSKVGIGLGSIFGLLIMLGLLFYYARKRSYFGLGKERTSRLLAIDPFSPDKYSDVHSNPTSANTTMMTGHTPLVTEFGGNAQVITVSHQNTNQSFSLMPPPHMRGLEKPSQAANATQTPGSNQTTPSNSPTSVGTHQPMPRILEEKRQLAMTRSLDSGLRNPLIQLAPPEALEALPEYH